MLPYLCMSKTKSKKSKNIEKRRKRKKELLKHKQEEWERGRIMKEERKWQERNSPEYTAKLSRHITEKIQWAVGECSGRIGGCKDFLHYFFQFKPYIRDLLIYWNPEVEINEDYLYLKQCLELYWDLDDKTKLLEHVRELGI